MAMNAASAAAASYRRAAGAGARLLAGCDQLSQAPWFRDVSTPAEDLTEAVAAVFLSPSSMAKEFTEVRYLALLQGQRDRPPGRCGPTSRIAASGFADWRLEVGGLVETPGRVSLADLRAMPRGPRSPATTASKAGAASAIGPALQLAPSSPKPG